MLESIRVYSAALIEQEELRLQAMQRNTATKSELRGRIQSEERAIRLLKESVTRNFTAMIEGKMTEAAFLEKKEIINGIIAQKEAQLAVLGEQLSAVSAGKPAIDENLSRYRVWQSFEKLDRDIVDLLIKEVIVYDESQIEIVWADRE